MKTIIVSILCALLVNLPVLAARGPFTASNYFTLGLNAINSRISGSSSVTIAAWVRWDGTVSSDQVVVSELGATDFTAILMALTQSGSDMVLRASGRSTTNDAGQNVYGSTPIPSGVWVHCAAVFNYTAKTAQVHFNGNLDGSGSSLAWGSNTYANGTNNTHPSRIGGFPTINAPLSGAVADVAIWRVALTDGQIHSLTRGQSPADIRPLPVLYFPLSGNRLGDPISGITATQVGTVPLADHPRLHHPR